jgi:hypothetical protein
MSIFTKGLRLVPNVYFRTAAASRAGVGHASSAPALSAHDCVVLREMAKHSGWVERGGLAIRKASAYQSGGEVIGRTSWVGQPEWARGFGYSKAEIQAITEKAIAGKRLGRKQRLLFQAMRDTMNGKPM